jgi:prophage antirepressor-like protein
MKEIQTFNHEMFGQIRTMIQESGQIMFVGKDVATALGYSNTRDALSKHVDAEDKLESQIATSGQRRAIILINN